MRRGITYIEVIISITIAVTCFIPLLNMLYISTYNDKVAKNIYFANLHSKNMIMEIENNLQNEIFLSNNFFELTGNDNFDEEYMANKLDYYVHIENTKGEVFELKSRNLINGEINNNIIVTNDMFNNNYVEDYDIIIKNNSSVELLLGEDYVTISDQVFINNIKDFTKICIHNDEVNIIHLNFSTSNKVLIHVVGEHAIIKTNSVGNIVYTDKTYNNDYYIVNVLVYIEGKLMANNFKIVNR